MNAIQSDVLWQKLQSFSLDVPGAALTFTHRLARENEWSVDFAERVVDEYKNFVYLAMRAGHSVTPSEEVDQAWHLHLCYTRSYWDDMCGNVLERPLHHGPTQGGADESAKYHDWYALTLASYRRVFGEAPPADIWPPVEKRFAADWRWVDVKRNWVVRKPRMLTAGVAAVILPMSLAAFSVDAITAIFCLIIGIALLMLLVVLLSGKRGRGAGRGGRDSGFLGGWFGCGSGCSSDGGSGCGGGGCGGCGG
ncbi:MAG: hypothetical protein AAGD32_09810 [Planctomycetota bacterium]